MLTVPLLKAGLWTVPLVASRAFDGRIQLLEYVLTVLPGPPGTSKADT